MNGASQQTATSRILVVDDHPLFREGLRQLINREPQLTVCGEARDAEEAMRLVGDTKPDLVLIDISLGSSSGIDLLRTLKASHPELPLLVVSMHDESLYGERALRAGAMGYVMKHEPPDTVRTAIMRVLAGDMYLSEKLASSVVRKLMRPGNPPQESPVTSLSDRELEVFRLLGQGKGRREIARELNVTLPTISSFTARIKEKLQLKTSAELLLHAIQWVQQEQTPK